MYYFCFSDFTKQGKGSLPYDAWIIEIPCSIVYPFGNVILQLHVQGKSGSTVPSLVTYFRCGFVQKLEKKSNKINEINIKHAKQSYRVQKILSHKERLE